MRPPFRRSSSINLWDGCHPAHFVSGRELGHEGSASSLIQLVERFSHGFHEIQGNGRGAALRGEYGREFEVDPWNEASHDNAARRYLTTAIFPVYILHQTIIVVVAHALKPVNLLPAVEGPLLILVTATGCLLGYEVIRRSVVLRPLFGLASGTVAKQAVAQPVQHLAPQDVQ